MRPVTLSKKVVWKFRPRELASGCPVFAPSQTLGPSLRSQPPSNRVQTWSASANGRKAVFSIYHSQHHRDMRAQTFHSQPLSRTILQPKARKPRSKIPWFSLFMPKTTINFHTATEKWTTILKVKFQRTHSYTLFSVKIGCIKCRCSVLSVIV